MMKTTQNQLRWLALIAGIWGVAVAPSARGQFFSSGSDGSDGALELAAGESREIDLGLADTGAGNGVFDEERFAIVFSFSNITLGSNSVLTFKNHPKNPPVIFRSQGDVIIQGAIVLDGKSGPGWPNPKGGEGGPGGWAGGAGPLPGLGGAADGLGPGGGLAGTDVGVGDSSTWAGSAAHAQNGRDPNPPFERDGRAYGTPLLLPMIGGGSGAGGNASRHEGSGPGGGGAITIASDTLIEVRRPPNGGTNLLARGGNGAFRSAHGAGGAVRLVAPRVRGNGKIDVAGGGGNGGGGAGYIRIDCVFKDGLEISWDGRAIYSVGANMLMFAPYTPRLEITMIGTTPVAGDEPALLETAEGADPVAVDVVVSARGFPPGTDVAYVHVKVTPERVRGEVYPLDIVLDGTAGDGTKTGSGTVTVDFPPAMLSRVDAWLRAAP